MSQAASNVQIPWTCHFCACRARRENSQRLAKSSPYAGPFCRHGNCTFTEVAHLVPSRHCFSRSLPTFGQPRHDFNVIYIYIYIFIHIYAYIYIYIHTHLFYNYWSISWYLTRSCSMHSPRRGVLILFMSIRAELAWIYLSISPSLSLSLSVYIYRERERYI